MSDQENDEEFERAGEMPGRLGNKSKIVAREEFTC